MNDFSVEDLYAQKIADISDIPVEYVLKLRDLGLLNIKHSRDMLIKHDCVALLKTKKFTVPQIYDRLSGIYNLSTTAIQGILKLKNKKIYYCKHCGAEISKTISMRNSGLCIRCISKQTIL